jgi:lysophospholipase L1-like esterase
LLFLAAVAQGLWLRRHVRPLPAPVGRPSGVVGQGEREVRLLVVGESSAVGIGVRSYDETLAAHIATLYSERAGCVVHWSAIGKSGATVDELLALLACQPPESLKADVVVMAIGVNDVLRFRSPLHWRRSLRSLMDLLRVSTGCQVMLLSPIPPLWKFALLPVPLRYVLGGQAFLLDFCSQIIAARDSRVRHLRIPLLDQTSMLCEDRFHPSSCGYREWARHIVLATSAGLPATEPRPADVASEERSRYLGSASTFAAQMKSFCDRPPMA